MKPRLALRVAFQGESGAFGEAAAVQLLGGEADASSFDPRTNLVFSSNGDGTLTVVHEDSPDQFTVVESVAIEDGARTMTLNEDSGTVYLVTAKVGPKLFLSFLLEIFYWAARPVTGWLGLFFLLIALMMLIRGHKPRWTKTLLSYRGVFLVTGVILVALYWNYDSLLLQLSPQNFHMAIWGPSLPRSPATGPRLSDIRSSQESRTMQRQNLTKKRANQ